MSSYGEDIIRETFEKFGDAIGVQMQMPDAMITNLGAMFQAQIDLLAELQSTGRLLADDEMRLTAEQVEDVRALVWLDGRRNFDAFHRLRALLPATEPAEDGWGDVNPNDPQGRTYRETAEEYYATPVTERKCCGYCNSTDATLLRSCTNCGAIEDDPWGKTKPAEEPRCTICNLSESEGRHFDYDHPFTTELGPFDDEGNERTTPAPAEPAEEETKAELPTEVGDRIRASVTRWSSALEWPDSNPYIDTFVLSSSGFWDAENDQFTVVPSCFSYIEVLEVLPSPVVPAPTETEAGHA